MTPLWLQELAFRRWRGDEEWHVLCDEVRHSPNDNGHRRKLAALLTNDDPLRAELLDVQVALDESPDFEEPPAKLVDEERRLIARLAELRPPPMSPLADGHFEWMRGLAERLTLSSTRVLNHLDVLQRACLIRELRVHIVEPMDLPSVASLPHLETLNLALGGIGDDGLAVLAAQPSVSIRRLILVDNDIGTKGLAALFGSPLGLGLTQLNLGDNGLNDDDVVQSSPHWSGLRHLSLARERIRTQRAVQAISDHIPRLRALNLSGLRFDEPPWEALTEMTELRELTLVNTGLDDHDAKRLAADLPDMLEHFNLALNRISSRGFSTLAAGGRLQSCRVLSLDGNSVGSEGLAAIRDGAPHVRQLSLRNVAIRGALHLPFRITRLNLANNRLRPDQLHSLLTQPAFQNLARLDLSFNPLDDDSAKQLCSHMPPNLVWLGVQRCRFSTAAISELEATVPAYCELVT